MRCRHRGGPSTKSPAVVDALGNPVALSLTPGPASDISQAIPLLDALETRGITPVTRSKANHVSPRKTDFARNRERNLVERCFGKLKQFRAIVTRDDKLANTCLAAVVLVCALFWLN